MAQINLLSILNNTGIQRSDPALYQVIAQLINRADAIGQLLDAAEGRIASPTKPWTPTDGSGAGLTFTITVPGLFVKIGTFVIASVGITYPVTASGATATIISLPVNVNSACQYSAPVYFTDLAADVYGLVGDVSGTTVVRFFSNAGAGYTNANLSAKNIRFTALYISSN